MTTILLGGEQYQVDLTALSAEAKLWIGIGILSLALYYLWTTRRRLRRRHATLERIIEQGLNDLATDDILRYFRELAGEFPDLLPQRARIRYAQLRREQRQARGQQ